MEISEIHIIPVKQSGGIIAFASVVLNGQVLLTGIAVHEKRDGSGYRLTYPTRRVGQKDRYLFRPLTPETSALIEQAVFEKLKIVLEGCHDRHNRPHAGIKRV